ncbi:MAG: serine/threonine protein kinase [Chloroflexi bacterium]|nr:serine/threonine protein kinase [Chloroflexota bacterium]
MDIGDVINKSYQVVEHIGRGGMADVWSARDSKLNRMVAVKTILHGLSPDSDPLGMFKREAQTIAALEHPHILPVYDFGEYQNSLFIVMRYVSGGSLAAWMERSKLPIDEAMRVLAAVAQALDYAHGRNVIHLDLKPQNILLDTHLSPYLGDFGLATALDVSGRAQNPGSGTLLYMAPEQLTSDTLDKRADIYSFAIMAFHILNGRLPFDGASPMVMKQLQLQSELAGNPAPVADGDHGAAQERLARPRRPARYDDRHGRRTARGAELDRPAAAGGQRRIDPQRPCRLAGAGRPVSAGARGVGRWSRPVRAGRHRLSGDGDRLRGVRSERPRTGRPRPADASARGA